LCIAQQPVYAGVAGLYDYGPPGSALQANIMNEWRKHFVVEEGMLELDTTIMTPAPVFETSGHVARFADWMVKDTKTGDILRADHLVKGVLEARLAGGREARGKAALPQEEDKKKKRKQKVVHVQLPDEVVEEYNQILAKVSREPGHLSVPAQVLRRSAVGQLLRPRIGRAL
jgi:glycyl-tRNA synthetase